MEKIKLIALIGKSASGKDSIANTFCDMFPKVKRKISTTTRPKREYEVEGVDYYFVNEEVFINKLLNFELIEACDFRDWFYGTDIKELSEDSINIGVFSPNGVRALKEDSRIKLMVVYIQTPDKIRLLRSLAREESPDIQEIIRRYGTDETDFSDIDFDFIPMVNDGNSTPKEVAISIARDAAAFFRS